MTWFLSKKCTNLAMIYISVTRLNAVEKPLMALFVSEQMSDFHGGNHTLSMVSFPSSDMLIMHVSFLYDYSEL